MWLITVTQAVPIGIAIGYSDTEAPPQNHGIGWASVVLG